MKDAGICADITNFYLQRSCVCLKTPLTNRNMERRRSDCTHSDETI